MTALPIFHGLDGLMTLSRRDGVDIRPTLLRVLTDLYVQASSHTRDEEQQFVELTSRLIDEVDDATLAAVRARLSVYPQTPRETLRKLGLRPASEHQSLESRSQRPQMPPIPDRGDITTPKQAATSHSQPMLSMQPNDASELLAMFNSAKPNERALILYNLVNTPLMPSTRIDPRRAERAIIALEQAAMVADNAGFTAELGDALILTSRIATDIVNDSGGEPLACALKALGMPSEIFQRVLLFLNPSLGASVRDVYRLARLFDAMSERSALIMLAAWRGASIAAARTQYRPALYDDEKRHIRTGTQQVPRTGHLGVILTRYRPNKSGS